MRLQTYLLSAACALLSWKAAAAESTPKRPNILIIVADDLGYSDIGAFGGEIDTPNLDALARRGMRLTGFYTTPACSPTRAMLMTGRDNHEAGFGSMTEVLTPEQRGKPGYEGHLPATMPTLAERLRATGYITLMSGKWHLGAQPGQTASERGFDRAFTLLQGAHNHFGLDQSAPYRAVGAAPSYRLDGNPVAWPIGAYSSDHFTNMMIGFLRDVPKGKPFFAYLAYTAPHWPLQAPRDAIAKYRGRYEGGPAALARARMARMKALGIVPARVDHRPIDDRWSALSAEERAIEVRKMEVYAAMVDRMDQNIGRVLDTLRARSELDNTVVLFMSDNGPEGLAFNRPVNPGNPTQPIPGAPLDNSLGNIGAGNSYVSYGRPWGEAASAPYWGTKEHTSEGGIHSPAIIAGPRVTRGKASGALLQVVDVMPTALALAGVAPDASSPPLEGRDWSRLLAGSESAVRTPEDTLSWELFYRRAIRRGTMKAVYQPTRVPFFGEQTAPGETKWQLYDLASDPGETRDLSAERPELLRELVARWHAYAQEKGVVLLPDEEGGAAAAGGQ